MQATRNQVQSYFYGDPKSIGERILLIKRENRLDEYREHLTDVCEFGNVWQGITGRYRGGVITIIVTGIGPSLVGDAVYALHRPDSICLYSGTCGGLADGLEIGDYVVADQAVCGDGYTFHLGNAPLSMVSGHPETLASLKHLLTSRVGRLDSGVTFTTSSVVREVDPDFWNSVGTQYQAIEMGAAALLPVARAAA
jgi:nucleoside phosphorylase